MIYFQIGTALLEVSLVAALFYVVLQTLRPASSSTISEARIFIGNVLISVAALVFIASGLSKFVRVQPAVAEMTLLGLTGAKYVIVASIEILSGVLILLKPLRSISLLFVSAHVGGAICAHLIAEQYFAILPSAVLLTLCWLGMFLRHPQILWSLTEYGDGDSATMLTRRFALRPLPPRRAD